MLDGAEHSCAAPFSWLVTRHLKSLWEESEFIPGLSLFRHFEDSSDSNENLCYEKAKN